jgi:hypothetical protein
MAARWLCQFKPLKEFVNRIMSSQEIRLGYLQTQWQTSAKLPSNPYQNSDLTKFVEDAPLRQISDILNCYRAVRAENPAIKLNDSFSST